MELLDGQTLRHRIDGKPLEIGSIASPQTERKSTTGDISGATKFGQCLRSRELQGGSHPLITYPPSPDGAGSFIRNRTPRSLSCSKIRSERRIGVQLQGYFAILPLRNRGALFDPSD